MYVSFEEKAFFSPESGAKSPGVFFDLKKHIQLFLYKSIYFIDSLFKELFLRNAFEP